MARWWTLAVLAAAAAVTAVGVGGAPARTTGVGKTLVVAAGSDQYFSSPKWPRVGRYPVNANVAEGLVRMTPGYGVAPALATRWKFIAPNTWRFFLRRGVRFHDGSRFDANAVKFTFDLAAAAGVGRSAGLDDKAKISVVGPYTIDITPSFPNRRLVEQIVHPTWGILAPGSTPAQPVGTGPFRLVSYDRNRELVVRRFDGYWGKKPRLAQITFRFVPDANARVLALESRAVDIAQD